MCACSKSGLSATVLRVSCLIAAIVASRFSRFDTVSSSVNDRRAGCLLLNLRRMPVLLLKYLLLDPFSTLLGLFFRHSLSRFLNPSRCSDQPRLSLLSAAADDHPNCLALDHHELLHGLTSSSSSLVLETRLFWAFGLGGSPGLTVAFLNIPALPLSVSHGNPCTSAW